jgi:hypothetical protein
VRGYTTTEFSYFGKVLAVIGLFVAGAGLFLVVSGKTPCPERLPGDIFIKGKNYSLYLPITTCLVVSIIGALVFSCVYTDNESLQKAS